jgi:protein SCO1/2
MMRATTILLVFLQTVATDVSPPLGFAQQQGNLAPNSGESIDEVNRSYFTDGEVLSQDGEKFRFYSDLLKGKVVLINFFYTNCPTAPISMARVFKVQKLLGDELGAKVFLISISVDPDRDSVEAVKEYSRKFNPQKGWVFITGGPDVMNVINRKLGNTLRLPEGHLQLLLLGNLKTGNWMKMLETAPPMSIVEGLRSLDTQG